MKQASAMDANNQWHQQLISLAKSKGMCTTFSSCLKKVKTKADSLKLYEAGIDWALENDFAGIEFLRSNYTKRELESFGIYIDREFKGEVINNHIFQVFHNCTGSIKVELNRQKIIIPTLYLANGSSLNVEVDREIDIAVYLFDTAKINSTGKYLIRKVNLSRYQNE